MSCTATFLLSDTESSEDESSPHWHTLTDLNVSEEKKFSESNSNSSVSHTQVNSSSENWQENHNNRLVPETPSPLLFSYKRRKQEQQEMKPKRTCLNHKVEPVSSSIKSTDTAMQVEGQNSSVFPFNCSSYERGPKSKKRNVLFFGTLPQLGEHHVVENSKPPESTDNTEVSTGVPLHGTLPLYRSNSWSNAQSSNSSSAYSSSSSSYYCLGSHLKNTLQPNAQNLHQHCKAPRSSWHENTSVPSGTSHENNTWNSCNYRNFGIPSSLNSENSTCSKVDKNSSGSTKIKKKSNFVFRSEKFSNKSNDQKDQPARSFTNCPDANSSAVKKCENSISNHQSSMNEGSALQLCASAISSSWNNFQSNILRPLMSPFMKHQNGKKNYDNSDSDEILNISSSAETSHSLPSQQQGTCRSSSIKQEYRESKEHTWITQNLDSQTNHEGAGESTSGLLFCDTSQNLKSQGKNDMTGVEAHGSWISVNSPTVTNYQVTPSVREREQRVLPSNHFAKSSRQFQKFSALPEQQHFSNNMKQREEVFNFCRVNENAYKNSNGDRIHDKQSQRLHSFSRLQYNNNRSRETPDRSQSSRHTGQRTTFGVHQEMSVDESQPGSSTSVCQQIPEISQQTSLNSDLCDAQSENEDEYCTPLSSSSQSESEGRGDVSDQMNISVVVNVSPTATARVAVQSRTDEDIQTEDQSSDEDIVVISNESSNFDRNFSANIQVGYDWRSVDSDTTSTPSSSDVTPPSEDQDHEVFVVSPDPVAQVSQMEEDEHLARMLQAQFDAEQGADVAGGGDGDTSDSLSVVDSDHERGRSIWDHGDVLVTTSTSSEGSISSLPHPRRGSTRRRFFTRSTHEAIRGRTRRSSRSSVRVSRGHNSRWISPRRVADRFHHHHFPVVHTEMIMGLRSGLNDGNDYEELWNLTEAIGEAITRGLSKAEINRLPTRTFSQSATSGRDSISAGCSDMSSLRDSSLNHERECRVCLSSYETGEILRILPCFHEYHANCIDKWLKSNRSCPTCRVEVLFEQ